MSNFKMVVLVAAMIGGVVAGVHYGGKSFFKQMVGGGPFYSEAEMQKVAKDRPAPSATPTSDHWNGSDPDKVNTPAVARETESPAERYVARASSRAGDGDNGGYADKAEQ